MPYRAYCQLCARIVAEYPSEPPVVDTCPHCKDLDLELQRSNDDGVWITVERWISPHTEKKRRMLLEYYFKP